MGDRGKRGEPGKIPKTPAPRPRWLWFRNERGGRLKAKEELEGLPLDGRAGLSVRIDRYMSGECRRKDVDPLGDGLYELRYRSGNNHFRLIFMAWGSDYVALTAYYKNQQRTPRKYLDRARRRAARWRKLFDSELGAE